MHIESVDMEYVVKKPPASPGGVRGRKGAETGHGRRLQTCPIGQEIVNVRIKTDWFPDETSWTLTDTCDGTNKVVLTGGPYSLRNSVYSKNVCADPGREYKFTIKVSYFSSWAMCL